MVLGEPPIRVVRQLPYSEVVNHPSERYDSPAPTGSVDTQKPAARSADVCSEGRPLLRAGGGTAGLA